MMDSAQIALPLPKKRHIHGDDITILIRKGINIDLCHEHGQEILLSAIENDSHEAADRLVSMAWVAMVAATSSLQQQHLSILLAAYDGNIAEFRRMTAAEDLSLSGVLRKVGEMSFFIAVEQQNLAMTQTLLDLSVDVNARASSGQSALHRATRRKNVSLIKLLLGNNALVDSKDDYGRTPWSANVYLQDNTVLDVLLHAGADPNTKGLQGVSELYTAAKDGETDLVRFMLNSGTSPSIQTDYQWAPLHWAARYGHKECVRILIEAGADVSVISDQGVTPLDLAIEGYQPDAIEILTCAGAKKCKENHVASYTKRLSQLNKDSDAVTARTTEALEQAESEHAVVQKKDSIARNITKLRLVYDKPLSRTLRDSFRVGQYVYMAGTSGPSENIYQISHLLETRTDCISVRKSPRRAKMSEYPLPPGAFDDKDVLYDIVRSNQDSAQFKLIGRRQNPLPETFELSQPPFGDWEIRHDQARSMTPLFRTMRDWSQTSPQECRWINDTDTLVARCGREDDTSVLCFEVGVERPVQDLIVTCWIAGLWFRTQMFCL